MDCPKCGDASYDAWTEQCDQCGVVSAEYSETVASEQVHEAILSLARAKNHDDVPVMVEDKLDRITTDLQVVRQAIQFHET